MKTFAIALLSFVAAFIGAQTYHAGASCSVEQIGTGCDQVHLDAPELRIDSGDRIEFGHNLSTIEGDSSSVWISTRDGTSSTVARFGVIADHDGLCGIGFFDGENSPKNQPDGPSKNDTIQGLGFFYAKDKYPDPPELWVKYEDDAGTEYRAYLADFETW